MFFHGQPWRRILALEILHGQISIVVQMCVCVCVYVFLFWFLIFGFSEVFGGPGGFRKDREAEGQKKTPFFAKHTAEGSEL